MKLDIGDYGLIKIPELSQNVLDDFTCGVINLDEFLKNEALSFHNSKISFTTCVFHRDFKGQVGYFTMSNDSIKLNDSEVMDLGLNTSIQIPLIPAVLIGKFAIHESLIGNGMGKDVMELAIGEILDIEGPSAARLAVVDSVKEPKVIEFYESCGFQHSLFAMKQARHQGSNTIKMFRDVLA